MEIAEHITALRREGGLLADAAAGSDLDAPIPTCPEWRLRDLLRHIGYVHRWAATYVRQHRTEPMDKKEEEALIENWPDDRAIVEWFREGHAALLHTLESAPPDLACWSFLPAPSPLAFWARRQAHETAIHRTDAESAGGTITAFPPPFAADGIDELLYGFVSRPRGQLRADPSQALQIHATDAARDWLVRIGPDRVEVRSERGEGDCAVYGCASDLYLLLWNRGTPDGLELRGDATLLDLWRQSVQIRWT
jgi:uncharacterized protein (TIGR03083 family)